MEADVVEEVEMMLICRYHPFAICAMGKKFMLELILMIVHFCHHHNLNGRDYDED